MSDVPMPPERFRDRLGVSPDTMDRLTRYEALLIKWQKAINLIGPKTIGEIWERHFLDSAQFWPCLPTEAQHLVDVGSGAGFPGLVLAILAQDDRIGRRHLHVHLVESDQRKATFLREAARELGLTGVTVHALRIEQTRLRDVDVVTARACAPLSQLLLWTHSYLRQGAVGIFAKGAQAAEERSGVTGYDIDQIPSMTDPNGCLLVIRAQAIVEGNCHVEA